MEVEKKMIVDNYERYSEGSPKIMKEDAKSNGIRRNMNEEENDRELDEIVRHLGLLMDLLQKRDEDRYSGWKLIRKVKWLVLKQKQRKKNEGLGTFESKKKVHICELEQCVILGEEDEAMKPYVLNTNGLCVFANGKRD